MSSLSCVPKVRVRANPNPNPNPNPSPSPSPNPYPNPNPKPTQEPIRPFISRVRPLWEEHGVSTILVVGGAGDYFDVADSVVMMDS